MTPRPASISRGSLEELGLYNVLTRVALADPDVDPFLLTTLREKGFVDLDAMSLTEAGMQTLRALTVRLGWFYPEVPADIHMSGDAGRPAQRRHLTR